MRQLIAVAIVTDCLFWLAHPVRSSKGCLVLPCHMHFADPHRNTSLHCTCPGRALLTKGAHVSCSPRRVQRPLTWSTRKVVHRQCCRTFLGANLECTMGAAMLGESKYPICVGLDILVQLCVSKLQGQRRHGCTLSSCCQGCCICLACLGRICQNDSCLLLIAGLYY